MKVQIGVLCLVYLFLSACSSSKTAATPEQIQALDQLVESQSFKMEFDWALPQATNAFASLQNSGLIAPGNSVTRISLIGISNQLELEKGIISSKLPYYGEVFIHTGYNEADVGISLDGNIKDYKAVKNENNTYTISFDAKSKSENYDVTIQLYPSLKSELFINSGKRFPIRYTGKVVKSSE